MPAIAANKSDRILAAAADLFSSRPFHEVRLEDIAVKAGVGKGTVYLYWSSKEEVYMAVVRQGFTAMHERLQQDLPTCRGMCWAQIEVIVGAVVDFAFAFPAVYRLMRSGQLTPEDPELQAIRRLVTEEIERVLKAGVASGQINDPCPALTTQYLLSCVRGAMLYPPPEFSAAMLKAHLLHVLRRGLSAGGLQ